MYKAIKVLNRKTWFRSIRPGDVSKGKDEWRKLIKEWRSKKYKYKAARTRRFWHLRKLVNYSVFQDGQCIKELKKGTAPAHKIGNRIYFLKSELIAYIINSWKERQSPCSRSLWRKWGRAFLFRAVEFKSSTAPFFFWEKIFSIFSARAVFIYK